jgi:hypothetical protein
MAIFYQHIGEKLWLRDAPRSIGTIREGLKRFSWLEIEPFLSDLDAYEVMTLRSKIVDLAPTGFQIWGIPSGAQRVLEPMGTGDFLMLLESTDFSYVGQVIHRVSQPLWGLSGHIWGEQRFPLIILLQGELINYGWDAFSSHFGFDAKYHMRGNTMKLADERVALSTFSNEDAFIARLLTTTGVQSWDQETDFRAFAGNLQVHFRLVKERARQQSFRTLVLSKQGYCCAVCDISIPAVLDAAHLIPKEHDGTDDFRNGLALCALHHRLLDSSLFAIDPLTLMIHPANGYTLTDLRILRPGLTHLESRPHKTALEWRWKQSSNGSI